MIDYSVYPDLDRLPDLVDDEERADYVARICGAWDFGIVPTRETFQLFGGWREVFDRFPLASSPAYHAFRSWWGWPLAAKGELVQAGFEREDALRGRFDPCISDV
ncbi:hypothetical protein EPN44_14205 [bacterium]|nr:MAG: hypothetical protein EPN44_14205 [bacterium]